MSRPRRSSGDQYAFRSMDRDRLWSRMPDRTGDPIGSPEGCVYCDGTGVST